MHYLKDGRTPRLGETMAYPALARHHAADRRARAAMPSTRARSPRTSSPPCGPRARSSRWTILPRTESTWVKPISTDFVGHEILEIPPSGQGLTALIALNILSQFGLRATRRIRPSATTSRSRR